MAEKRPIDVISRTTYVMKADKLIPKIKPLVVVWPDECGHDKEYPVSVLDERPAAATKIGGYGQRYVVQIGRAIRFLYNMDGMWYIEKPD